MSIASKYGVCIHCGHDHGRPGQPIIPPIFAHCAKVEALLHMAMRQLENWQEKYRDHQPEWLPPAGDVRLAEDVAELLTPNVRVEGREVTL